MFAPLSSSTSRTGPIPSWWRPTKRPYQYTRPTWRRGGAGGERRPPPRRRGPRARPRRPPGRGRGGPARAGEPRVGGEVALDALEPVGAGDAVVVRDRDDVLA